MSERESRAPEHEQSTRLGDLFENLPAPSPQVPTAGDDTPAPGSRRAAREAAAREQDASPTPDAGVAPGADVPARPVSASAATTADAAVTDHRPQANAADVEPVVTRAMPVAATSADETPAPGPRRSTGTEDPAPALGGGLDEIFAAQDDGRDHGAPTKKKRRKGCLVALIIVLVILGGIAAGGVWVANTFGDRIADAMGWGEPKDWEPGQATGEVYVTIKQGDTGGPVSTALYEAGVTKTEDVFYDYLIDENIAVTFYPGVYRLQKKMTAEDALAALRNEENKLENTVSMPEGGTIESALPSMAETLGMPLADLEAAVADPSAYGVQAQSLEGWLFPAVYTFDPEVTATQVIQRMVDRTRESLAAAGVPDEDAQRILTIASIIQREGRTDDFAKVSRVIQNRLDDDMLLQMDSTAQYGNGSLHEGVVSSSAEALEDPNEWNTYVNKGLPATPIASPNDAAIDAAMHPADGPWIYFVTVNLETGETQFSETLAEHEQGVEKWRDWCRANPDAGC
jgi:UPF0755 protein